MYQQSYRCRGQLSHKRTNNLNMEHNIKQDPVQHTAMEATVVAPLRSVPEHSRPLISCMHMAQAHANTNAQRTRIRALHTLGTALVCERMCRARLSSSKNEHAQTRAPMCRHEHAERHKPTRALMHTRKLVSKRKHTHMHTRARVRTQICVLFVLSLCMCMQQVCIWEARPAPVRLTYSSRYNLLHLARVG